VIFLSLRMKLKGSLITTLINPLLLAKVQVIYLGMSDVLRKIKQTEREASKQLADAQEEASKIMADARKKSSELVSNAADESVSNTQMILESARGEADKEAKKVQKKGLKEVDSIESNASKNLDKAVKSIIDTMTSQ